MNNLKKLLTVFLALVLVLSLAACGQDKAPAGEEDTNAPARSDGAIGAVLLVSDTRLVLHYDDNGNVTVVKDAEGADCHSELVGNGCAGAVSQLLKGAQLTDDVKFILIKQAAGTAVPDADFLQVIVDEAKKVAGDLPVILSSAADQDGMGYFSPETAKTVLAAYLGNPQGATYAASSKAIDGYYSVSVTTDGNTSNYTVGALYGAVDVELEIGDDGSDIFEPDVMDPGIDDPSNMDPDEPVEDIPIEDIPPEDIPIEN